MPGSTRPLMRTVAPDGKPISIVPGGSATAGPVAGAGASSLGTSGTTSTGAKPAIAVASICLRQCVKLP